MGRCHHGVYPTLLRISAPHLPSSPSSCFTTTLNIHQYTSIDTEFIIADWHTLLGMPFVNPLSRKRPRSNSHGPSQLTSTGKIPRLDSVLYDGTASRKSVESNSTGRVSKVNVKSKVKRGVTNIMTLLGVADKDTETAELLLAASHQSLSVSTKGLRGGFAHANDSDATTLISPLRLRLTGAQTPELDDAYKPQSAPMTPRSGRRQCDEDETLPLAVRTSLRNLRRSQSTTGLQYKITQKLQQTFGHPTVVHKSELRSRPSVYSLHKDSVGRNGTHQSSSPSTCYSSSGSSPVTAQKSTPPTSDSVTVTPVSVKHYDNAQNDSDAHNAALYHGLPRHARMSPVPEGTVIPGLSIMTVEATATAKIFFETHFNTILNKMDHRELRRHELETRLADLELPDSVAVRARMAHERQESENLRLSRVFKSSSLAKKGAISIAVGGFEVVKVLGKGSFGVVRLVKEKPFRLRMTRSPSQSSVVRQSSRAAFKESAKEVLAPLHKRRRDLSKVKKEVYAMKVIRKSDMLRNSQEGHLRAERDFLVAAEGSQWVIPLLAAFQDNKFLYLVMDFCIGGDFLGLLIRKNTLSEEITKWYISEMILCVEEAHRMRWIHRDVKPDNLLIGADGHLKISDFGLAFDGE